MGLAPLAVERLLTALRVAADERGMGALVVEQHIGRALEIADRAVVLDRGRVVLARSSDDLLADPAALERADIGG